MRRFKRLESGYVWDRRLLFLVLAPAFILTALLSVDALTSDYTFYLEVDCLGYECDNPWYGSCPFFVESQMPRLCEQKTIAPGSYGEKPFVALEWLYFSFMGGFVLFFSLNHLLHNGGVSKQWK